MNKIALAQVTSNDDYKYNLKIALDLIDQAFEEKVKLLAFPENFLYLGSSKQYPNIATSIPGHVTKPFQEKAADLKISLLLGSVLERHPQRDNRFYNSSVLINEEGEISAFYRKIHLFDVDLPEVKLKESKHFDSGTELVVADTQLGQVGLAICYDLRFPTMFQKLTDRGAEIIFLPAAFTLPTGKDHWLPLLRARAIENQVYIAAPAQFGRHSQSRISFGSSVIIDPWGSVVSLAPEKTGLVFGHIDRDYLLKIRRRMPMASHKVSTIDC